MAGDADLSRVAQLIGQRTRSRMLMALTSGRELSASLLAQEAGVSASTASEHLRLLVDGGLVAVRPAGRYRHYRLAGPPVADLLERLIQLSPAEEISSLRASTRAAQLRRARTCYDHIAGVLGVGIMSSLLEQGHLTGGDGRYNGGKATGDRPASPGLDLDYRLTDSGRDFLDTLGVALPGGRRPLIRYCIDWTETRHHLAGQVGRGLRDRFLEAGWVRPHTVHRALVVTTTGERVLGERFALDAAP